MNEDTANALGIVSDWNKLLDECFPTDQKFRKAFKRKLDMIDKDLEESYQKCLDLIYRIEGSCQGTVSTCAEGPMERTMKIGRLQFFRGMSKKSQDLLDMIDESGVTK